MPAETEAVISAGFGGAFCTSAIAQLPEQKSLDLEPSTVVASAPFVAMHLGPPVASSCS